MESSNQYKTEYMINTIAKVVEETGVWFVKNVKKHT